MTSTEILKEIYALEVNAKIEWFWDSGFTFTLGDNINGYAESGGFDDFDEGVRWLYTEVLSGIAKRQNKEGVEP